MGTSAPSAMRILTIASATIKWRSNRKSLAFGRRGTYNPANRETGSGAFAFEQVTPCPRGPARKPGIPKQDPNAKRSRRNAVAAKFEKAFPGKNYFPKFLFPKEPRSHTDENDSAYGCAWGCRGRRGAKCHTAGAAGTTGSAADLEPANGSGRAEHADCSAGDQGSCRIQRLREFGRPRERCQRKDQRAGGVHHAVSQQRHEESGAGDSDGDLPAGQQPQKDDGDGHEAGDGGCMQ